MLVPLSNPQKGISSYDRGDNLDQFLLCLREARGVHWRPQALVISEGERSDQGSDIDRGCTGQLSRLPSRGRASVYKRELP
jgi:hypothetical protein